MEEFVGWKRTTQGVLLWPSSTRLHCPVRQQMSFTVWSPWVEASSSPSGLKAAAIVERGAGLSGQYSAAQRCNESVSDQRPIPRVVSIARLVLLQYRSLPGTVSRRSNICKMLCSDLCSEQKSDMDITLG